MARDYELTVLVDNTVFDMISSKRLVTGYLKSMDCKRYKILDEQTDWRLTYPINNHRTANRVCYSVAFNNDATRFIPSELEAMFNNDERIIRYLSVQQS